MNSASQKVPRPERHVRQLAALGILIAACAFFGYAFAGGFHRDQVTAESDISSNLTTDSQEMDFSGFLHTNPTHARMPCLLCHRREDNSSRIGFPGKAGHTPCIGCHQQQFAAGSGAPICTICHTNAEVGAMKRFPGLQDFTMRFNHSRHSGVNCSVCHKSSRQGIAFSIPSGTSAHTTCFQCHTASSANSMASCSVCHQSGSFVRTPETARAFQVNFSHLGHARAGMNCSTCHSIQTGTARGRQVTEPLASMHFAPARMASCAACHNGTRAFGANNFANCKRCHLGNSFKF
ncbi:MAG TPA: cytochrome c3 family protein [Pyrinomonadaceae bacterium]|jgi:Cytochrome c7 and related cytochrome c|nr:cytochrome c3 family protein [Pyrinomonadaceae bacterium]